MIPENLSYTEIDRYGKCRKYLFVICDCCGNEFPKRNSFVDPEKKDFCNKTCSDEYYRSKHTTNNPLTKICVVCEIEKSKTEFYKRGRSHDGLTPQCIDCVKAIRKKDSQNERFQKRRQQYLALNGRRHYLRNKYNIEAEDYLDMLEEQGCVCAICGNPETRTMGTGVIKPLSVDHNHETGEVRGLLCDSCNNGLGRFRDNPDLLLRAMEYLDYHNGVLINETAKTKTKR